MYLRMPNTVITVQGKKLNDLLLFKVKGAEFIAKTGLQTINYIIR